jgi:2'-5' RNA ligase
MRLFTGLSLPSHIIAHIESAMKQLCEAAPLRWSSIENLHITSKFIGEWPDERVPELEKILTEMEKPNAFSVSVARFGFLPNPHRPKIFFAGVSAEAGLAELAERTDANLAPLGVKRDFKPTDRPYTPHVTLARVGQAVEPVRALRERIAALTAAGSAFEFGSFPAREFHLYESKGSVYSRLSSFSLGKAAS